MKGKERKGKERRCVDSCKEKVERVDISFLIRPEKRKTGKKEFFNEFEISNTMKMVKVVMSQM